MQLLATSDGLQHHIDAKLPIRNAPPVLIQADHVESPQPPIVELPGAADEPSYHIVLAQKRGARPRTYGGQNAASDPLAIDAVRGRGQHFFLYAILETLIREVSVGVRNSEKTALRCPVMPIADGLLG